MKGQVYKQQGNIGLFYFDDNMSKLNKIGNPLSKLSQAVDFELPAGWQVDPVTPLHRGYTARYSI